MGIISFLIVGLIIGGLARLFKSGKQDLSLLATIGLGVVSALIAGVIASLFSGNDITDFSLTRLIIATVVAVMLVGTAEALTGKRSNA